MSDLENENDEREREPRSWNGRRNLRQNPNGEKISDLKAWGATLKEHLYILKVVHSVTSIHSMNYIKYWNNNDTYK